MRSAAIGIAGVLTLALSFAVLRWQSRDHVVVAGFWFENQPFEISGFVPARGGGRLPAEELRIVESHAWSELRNAFAGLRVSVSPAKNAMYRVRVVQDLEQAPWSPARRYFSAAGESRAVRPLGGRGSVSFRVLADNAVAYAPPGATRATILEGIGRGIGRAAAHEFVHQFFPSAPIHASEDTSSYEYSSAGRAEQYYGELHWNIAWPHLTRRFGPVVPSSSPPSRSQALQR